MEGHFWVLGEEVTLECAVRSGRVGSGGYGAGMVMEGGADEGSGTWEITWY